MCSPFPVALGGFFTSSARANRVVEVSDRTVRNTKGRMGTVLNIREVDFFEVAENFFFFGCVCGPPLGTAADTWKNAVDVVAARLLRYVHAGDDIEDLDKTIRESKKDILMSTLVASSTTISSFVPTLQR